jgi:hypothetical protein
MYDLPGAGVLIAGAKGLFLARSANDAVTVEPASTADTGLVFEGYDLPGVGVLIRAQHGWFRAHSVNGTTTIQRAGDDTGEVHAIHELPGAGVLIGAENGLFLAHSANHAATIEWAGKDFIGSVFEMHDLPGVGVLIWYQDQRAGSVRRDLQLGTQVFLARSANGSVAGEPFGTTGYVKSMYDLPGAGVLIGTDKGLFLARSANTLPTIEPTGKDFIRSVFEMHDLPGIGVLIRAEEGEFLAHLVNGAATVEPFPFAGAVDQIQDLPEAGVLIAATHGLSLVRSVNGATTVIVPKADTGKVHAMHYLRGAGVLIGAENGLFLARSANHAATIEPAGKADTGTVYALQDWPGVGMLVGVYKGWFLARLVNGTITVEPIGTADIGTVYAMHDLPTAGVLLGAERGLFLASETSLLHAKVEIRDRSRLDGSPPRPDSDLNFEFTLAHPCASVANKLNLRLSVTPPGRQAIEPKSEPQSVRFDHGLAAVSLPLRIDKAGGWSFQLMSTITGTERRVGEPQHLTFTSEGLLAWVEKWGSWLAGGLPIVLGLANAALFLFARRSAWAWRVATDDGLGTWMLRLGTLALSHFPKAQIWILDLYFCRRRAKMPAAPPFLPLPLTSRDDALDASDKALAPPWKGKRLWVQGSSGMGKTALFRHVTEAHFRDDDTAFAAFAKWGCVVVAFAARDFAGSGEDKDDPAWVIEAVRATLSSHGVTFADDKLLSRFLESGSIGIAIDGLNEVDRTRAITAFTRRFDAAPMLVTSQQTGGESFTTWRLPTDIRAFTADLLREYLDQDAAAAVMTRISASGLKDAIRSGYDVRLIIDLARADPQHAPLPADRLGLYAAVIAAGWPEVPEETRREQLNRAEAAAWRMVSERKPNEDMRRLKPDTDLAADLLVALSDAPERDRKPVRLIRRVAGGSFEFVHDQMHAYLAARWLTQPGFVLTELEKMIETSTIWTQAPDARRTLWGFAAALLDDERLIALWARVEDKEDWDTLRRALKAEAERRRLEHPMALQAE